jgi:hypothetical protein
MMLPSLHPIRNGPEAQEASLRSRWLGLHGCHASPMGGDVEGLCYVCTVLQVVAVRRGNMAF